jgi:hypothetical protein
LKIHHGKLHESLAFGPAKFDPTNNFDLSFSPVNHGIDKTYGHDGLRLNRCPHALYTLAGHDQFFSETF